MDWTRRDLLKTGMATLAFTAAPRNSATAEDPIPKGASPMAGLKGSSVTGGNRERLLLDFGWRFHFGHANDPAKDFGLGSGLSGNFQKTGNFLSAGGLAFNDTDWKPVDLPHDWAIELPFQNDPILLSKGFYPLGRTYPDTSVGWYRRIFEIPASDAGKRITLEFDGSYRETMVVLNGFYIGRHSGGYDPFHFDVTDFVILGGPNVLLVRVDASLSDGWFYEGAGIYRHVWLVKTNPVHVKKWGTFVRAEVQSEKATLHIKTEINNNGKGTRNARVISTILDPSGIAAGKVISAITPIPEWGESSIEQKLVLDRPALWSLEERPLYKLVTEVESNGILTDRQETPFGIRSLHIDGQKGFFLNGKPFKVKGTCNHQDHAGLGVALPDSAHCFRLRKLQEMGCNAIRTSHNPPTPELLDACDALGMLVLDETRMMSSNPEGLSQFENLVRRDRNHPSVFMWSMGNEEGQASTERGMQILTSMKAIASRHDGSRPVTVAPLMVIGLGGLMASDVIGYNYADPGAENFHKTHPDIPIIGTETVSAVGTRGKYITDPQKGFVGSYDPYTTTGRASAEGWWRFCNAQPWLAGGFVWTGFDYRGEPSPNDWPNISSQYGVLDTCGFPKDSFYYYQSWWTSRPVLHLFPHWNWPGMEGQNIAVWVYSNLDQVELFLNGQSLGLKDMKKDSHLAWLVQYAPGVIEVRGYKAGRLAMTTKRETTGTPAKLVMKVDREQISADGEDLAMFAVEVRDAQDRVVPTTGNDVTFHVKGAGRLVGTGNGDPTNHQSDKGLARQAFSGYCMAIVQSTKEAGEITLEATSPGLVPTQVTIAAKSVPLRPQVPTWDHKVPLGSGATGLWRTEPGAISAMAAFFGGGGDMVFTLVQEGNTLTGQVEGADGGFFSISRPIEPLVDGKVEGNQIFFKAANITYSGTIEKDRIQLKRTGKLGFPLPKPKDANTAEPRPVIGPPPDGSDPSFSADLFPKEPAPLLLHRTNR